jgi:DICT domain-containing protein
VLCGWERPGQDGVVEGERRFESLWSVEPTVVREATRLALALARHEVPELGDLADALADEAPSPDPIVTLRRATALTNRIVAYLDPESALLSG